MPSLDLSFAVALRSGGPCSVHRLGSLDGAAVVRPSDCVTVLSHELAVGPIHPPPWFTTDTRQPLWLNCGMHTGSPHNSAGQVNTYRPIARKGCPAAYPWTAKESQVSEL